MITPYDFLFDRHSEDAGIGDHINGLVMFDVAARYFDCETTESRDTKVTEINLRWYAGDAKVRRCYSDNDDSLIAAAKNLRWTPF